MSDAGDENQENVLPGIAAGIPIVVNPHMPPFSWTMHDGKLWADSMETIEAELNHEFLKSCGIASEKSNYIPMPDFLTV